MLFNHSLISKVQMFQSERWLNTKNADIPHDKIIVTFEGQKSFLGVNYHGTWKKTYKFKYRYTGVKDVKDGIKLYTPDPNFGELNKQLRDHLSKQHIEISRENYDYFKNLEPERFV